MPFHRRVQNTSLRSPFSFTGIFSPFFLFSFLYLSLLCWLLPAIQVGKGWSQGSFQPIETSLGSRSQSSSRWAGCRAEFVAATLPSQLLGGSVLGCGNWQWSKRKILGIRQQQQSLWERLHSHTGLWLWGEIKNNPWKVKTH